MADDPSPTALALQAPTYAKSLEEATRGELLWVGDDGVVQSPRGQRTKAMALYALVGGATAAGVTLAWFTLPAVMPIYLIFGTRFAVSVRAVNQLNQAMAELSLGGEARAQHASQVATRIQKAWYLPKRLRAFAGSLAASAAWRLGDHPRALAEVRKARLAFPANSMPQLSTYYVEIHVLAAMGNLKEARAMMAARGRCPEGEVMQLAHWIAELHVACATNTLELTREALEQRVAKASAMKTGGDLLLLCAWAYATLGEADTSLVLRAQAETRQRSQGLEHTMPALARWLKAPGLRLPAGVNAPAPPSGTAA